MLHLADTEAASGKKRLKADSINNLIAGMSIRNTELSVS